MNGESTALVLLSGGLDPISFFCFFPFRDIPFVSFPDFCRVQFTGASFIGTN